MKEIHSLNDLNLKKNLSCFERIELMGKTTVITHIQTQKKRRRVTKSLIYIFYNIKIKLKLEKYKAMYMYQIKELTHIYNMCYLKRKKKHRERFVFNL